MKTILFVVLAFLSTLIASGQRAIRCLSHIDARVTATGAAFDMNAAQNIVKDFPFGKVPELRTNPAKLDAFHRVWSNLDDLCLKVGNDLSAEGMKGYTKFSRVAIKQGDDALSLENFDFLKTAFTKNGSLDGPNLDKVMKQLSDDTRFDFDPVGGSFTSKNSPANYSQHPGNKYGQGEVDSITHIMHGHLENAKSLDPADLKSYFDDAGKVFDHIDAAMNHANKVWTTPGTVFEVDLGYVIGKTRQGAATSKMRVVLRGGTADGIHTAFPIP